MQTLRRTTTALLLAYALVACSSDDAKPDKDAGSESDRDPQSEEAGDAESEPERDAGGPIKDDTVPLTVWVDDLVDNHTTDDAVPDTVDDKKISDDTDETSFDKYLP